MRAGSGRREHDQQDCGTDRHVKSGQRQLMEHLRSGDWTSVAKLPVVASDYMPNQFVGYGWIEQRGDGAKAEIKLTAAGLLALQAP
jgi:hypothetical protein